jgi:hypothetical protein
MRHRIEQTLSEGRLEIAVPFAGAVDALNRIDPAQTDRNVTLIVVRLLDHRILTIALIDPGLINWSQHAGG